MNRYNILIIFARVFVVIFSLLIYAFILIDAFSYTLGLLLNSILLILYFYIELSHLAITQHKLFWINPIALASIFTFLIPFGITNILYFLPESELEIILFDSDVTLWMNKLMMLVILGGVAMWIGYNSFIAKKLGQITKQILIKRRWIRDSNNINMPMIYILILISLLAKLIAINSNSLGYQVDLDKQAEANDYAMYLTILQSLSSLVLLLVAMKCFSIDSAHSNYESTLLLILFYNVAFGFLSGMKGSVIMPFIVVGLGYYSQKNKFPIWLFPVVLISIVFAYKVIEPYREAVQYNSKSSNSVNEIASTMLENTNKSDSKAAVNYLAVLTRQHLTHDAAYGIEYAEYETLSEDSPKFLTNIILAPLHALIPRFLWKDKPTDNLGLWYTNEVIGKAFQSSTAMSPFTYLNFAGGPLAVILGFLVIGIIHRTFFDGLKHFGIGGLIILFGLTGTLALVDNGYNNFFIAIIRNFPILIIVQSLLLRRSRP